MYFLHFINHVTIYFQFKKITPHSITNPKYHKIPSHKSIDQYVTSIKLTNPFPYPIYYLSNILSNEKSNIVTNRYFQFYFIHTMHSVMTHQYVTSIKLINSIPYPMYQLKNLIYFPFLFYVTYSSSIHFYFKTNPTI